MAKNDIKLFIALPCDENTTVKEESITTSNIYNKFNNAFRDLGYEASEYTYIKYGDNVYSNINQSTNNIAKCDIIIISNELDSLGVNNILYRMIIDSGKRYMRESDLEVVTRCMMDLEDCARESGKSEETGEEGEPEESEDKVTLQSLFSLTALSEIVNFFTGSYHVNDISVVTNTDEHIVYRAVLTNNKIPVYFEYSDFNEYGTDGPCIRYSVYFGRYVVVYNANRDEWYFKMYDGMENRYCDPIKIDKEQAMFFIKFEIRLINETAKLYRNIPDKFFSK